MWLPTPRLRAMTDVIGERVMQAVEEDLEDDAWRRRGTVGTPGAPGNIWERLGTSGDAQGRLGMLAIAWDVWQRLGMPGASALCWSSLAVGSGSGVISFNRLTPVGCKRGAATLRCWRAVELNLSLRLYGSRSAARPRRIIGHA